MKVPKMPGSRTLVRPTEENETKGGIIIPNVNGVSALEGTIVGVGPDCVEAKVGDKIAFAPYSKYVVPTIEGKYKNHLLINEEDILLYWVEEKGESSG